MQSAFLGPASILTGRTVWVDAANGVDATAIVGRQDKPTLGITGAIQLASAVVPAPTADNPYLVVVRPGTYDEQITLAPGVWFDFQLGATVVCSAPGAIVLDAPALGQIKIMGSGRFLKTGLAAVAPDDQAAFWIANADSHIDMTFQEAKCTMDAVGTDNAAVLLDAGYLKISCHAIDGIKAHGIRWRHGGILDLGEIQRITATEVAAIDIGSTTPDDATLNQGWALGVAEVVSDRDQRLIHVHDSVGLLGRYLTINFQTCSGGGFHDESDLFVLDGYMGLSIPSIDVFGAASIDSFIKLNSTTGGACVLSILDLQGNYLTSAIHIDTPSNSAQDIKIIRGVTDAPFLKLTQGFGSVSWEGLDSGGGVTYDGGDFMISGKMVGNLVISADGLTVSNLYTAGAVTAAAPQTVKVLGTLRAVGAISANVTVNRTDSMLENSKGLTNTATLNFGSILTTASADLTITVTGAAVGDAVAIGLPAAPTAGIVFFGFVSASDTVTIRAMNITVGSIDPASATYRATVFKA